MKVRELMRYPVPTVTPDATVKDVIIDLFAERKDTVLVASGGLLKKCEGIVTKGQIYLKVLAPNLDPSNVKVSEVITPQSLVTISPDVSCKEAAELMIKYKVIGKDLPLYKGIGSYGCHGVAPVGKLVSQ
jgi:CBS domain-containing protein